MFNIKCMVYPKEIVEALERRLDTQPIIDPSGTGAAANFSCGTFVRFALSIDFGQRSVVNASFSSNGCGYMLAAANALANSVAGKKLTELHGLSDADLNAYIREVIGYPPEARSQCVISAIDALRVAFADLRTRQIEEFRGEKALICTCFGVTEDAIDEVIEKNVLITVEGVTAACHAGSGCGSCRMLIQEIIDSKHF